MIPSWTQHLPVLDVGRKPLCQEPACGHDKVLGPANVSAQLESQRALIADSIVVVLNEYVDIYIPSRSHSSKMNATLSSPAPFGPFPFLSSATNRLRLQQILNTKLPKAAKRRKHRNLLFLSEEAAAEAADSPFSALPRFPDDSPPSLLQPDPSLDLDTAITSPISIKYLLHSYLKASEPVLRLQC